MAQEEDRPLLVVAQKDPEIEVPGPNDLFQVGCTVEILKMLRIPDGSQTVFVQGEERFHIDEWSGTNELIEVRGHALPEESKDNVHIQALVKSLEQAFEEMAELAPHLTGEHVVMAHNAETPGKLADVVAASLQLEVEERQDILEIGDLEKRLEQVNDVLVRQLELMKLSTEIQNKVQGEITQTQKEYYLRQQLEAIRLELGESDADDLDVREIRERLIAKDLPENVWEMAERELRRLERTNPSSPDWSVARTWLDWVADLPWNERSDDDLDLKHACEILDRDHHDLENVKKRILEFLAVRKLKKDMRGPILCFVGPPGVGKTSLGRSIADALGRGFARVSLGGVRDEAEIRGHRRTYVGALPGRIIQNLKRVGTKNPVFVLDEIDKLASGHSGDPSSALLEVLDPEQNAAFSDHYLEVDYDLSEVLFIATANWGDAIPSPLKDRMEIIEIPGYATHDKLVIAERHLVPKQLEDHGLKKSQLRFPKATLNAIIESYTREAGVRNLNRQLPTSCAPSPRNSSKASKANAKSQ